MNTNKKPNKKNHLTYQERFLIEKMIRGGSTRTAVARILGRGLSTISEEIKVNSGIKKYRALKAQARADQMQKNRKKTRNKILSNPSVARFVRKYIRAGYSPETVSHMLRAQTWLDYVSAKSIRKYVQTYINLNKKQ